MIVEMRKLQGESDEWKESNRVHCNVVFYLPTPQLHGGEAALEIVRQLQRSAVFEVQDQSILFVWH